MKKSLLPIAFVLVVTLPGAQAGPPDAKDQKGTIQMPEPTPSGFYISVFGGANFYQSSDSKTLSVQGATPIQAGTRQQIQSYFQPNSSADVLEAGLKPSELLPNGKKVHSPDFSSETNSNTGWYGGLKLGYQFPTQSIIKPALELEAFYFGNDTGGSLTSNKKILGLRTTDNDGDEATEPFLNPDAVVPPTKAFINFVDQMNAAVFMLNGVIKFDLGRFRPYIGAGLGLAYVTHDFGAQVGPGHPVPSNSLVIKTPSGAVERVAVKNTPSALNDVPSAYFSFGSDNETTFAWQALAGVEFEVTPRWSIFTEYKALWFLDGPYYRNYLSQMVGAGIRYNF